MKKDKGNLIRIFPAIFTVAAVAVMIVFYTGWMANVSRKDEVKQVARSYILSMETEGYLSSAMENSLMNDLASKGLENIDLAGTTRTEVSYGNAVFLCIKGDLRVNTYTTTGLFQLIRGGTTLPVAIEMESTAKN